MTSDLFDVYENEGNENQSRIERFVLLFISLYRFQKADY